MQYNMVETSNKSSYMDVRSYYDSQPHREWDRLELTQSRQLEYFTTIHYLAKYLPDASLQIKIADIGGGPGRYSIYLAKKGYSISLVDISKQELLLAKEKIVEQSVKNIEALIEANIIDLSTLPSNSFDAVLATGGVLSHVLSPEDRLKAITELIRIAKPKAPIFISVMSRFGEIGNKLSMSPEEIPLLENFLLDGEHINPKTGGFTHTHFFTPEELSSLVASTNSISINELVSLQSFGSPLREKVNNLQPELFEKWKQLFIKLSNEPSLLGISSHFMLIGTKNNFTSI
jgi:ubiquinone/menaquinone biosynthesis C-methylase UbiE